MSLESRWVDLIFTKLALVYGRRFWEQYPGLDPEVVRGNWAHDLDGMTGPAIQHALSNLPKDWPPNVLQFKDLCRQMRRPDYAKLPPPTHAVPCPPGLRERFKAAVQGMREGPDDRLRWARVLRAREQRGDRLTPAQRNAWRAVLPEHME